MRSVSWLPSGNTTMTGRLSLRAKRTVDHVPDRNYSISCGGAAMRTAVSRTMSLLRTKWFFGGADLLGQLVRTLIGDGSRVDHDQGVQPPLLCRWPAHPRPPRCRTVARLRRARPGCCNDLRGERLAIRSVLAAAPAIGFTGSRAGMTPA